MNRIPTALADAALVALAGLDLWLNLEADIPYGLALGVLSCAMLPMRHCFPLSAFLLCLPGSLVQDVITAPIVALYTLAARTRDRRLLALYAALFALVTAAPWPLTDFAGEGRTWTLVAFVYMLATAAAPVLLGQLVQARRDLGRQLVETEAAKEHERELHAQTVLARERAQLAREMHDVVSHQVSLIAVQAGAFQVAAADDEAREVARTIRTLSVDTLDELRTMVTLLRASSGDTTELAPQPTLADLRQLVHNSGLEAGLTGELPDPEAVPAAAQRALYRTVQEALTNVRKHAPGAAASVELWHDGAAYGVTITNGTPARPALPLPSAHHGLVGLRERAELLGGTLESGPSGDGGWRVRLRLPDRRS
ncbi:histidine kinase [Streptomyces rimosus subsp. pseudoverticillatus]|uniref:sensor histidine kinase n=1 Tax=Streptomyces rimosus TaxID=1927 RepID=UPI0006B27A40|nr:histidine kinase [Streptomyces rimosus]KOT78031.1 histidine kinase [Streptomyces rimosus subsp. pseudoverticillatus]